MTFTLSFDTNNAAFDIDMNSEIARILRDLAERIEYDDVVQQNKHVRDINGNIVGTYELKYNNS